MGLSGVERVKRMAVAVANSEPLASPKRMGHLPYAMKQYARIIPTFMHGKKISFTDRLTEKGGNRIRRVILPNVIYRYVYSRLLDMNIYARITTTTLREMEKKGGFDEYVLSMGTDRLCDDEAAAMYKRKIEEAFKNNRDANLQKQQQIYNQKSQKETSASMNVDEMRRQIEELAAKKYGETYANTLKTFHQKMDDLKFKKNPGYMRRVL